MKRKLALYFALGLLALLPFYRVLTDWSRVLLDRDLLLVYLPTKLYWTQSILEYWRLPQWNPMIYSGTPALAEANLALLYPLNLIFLLFGSANIANALTFFIVVHYALIATGSFFFLRGLNIRNSICFILVPLTTWGGTAISVMNLPHLLAGAAATFWFLGFWLRYLKRSAPLHLVLAALALAWPIYAGDPQYTYILSIVAFGLSLRSRDPWQPKLKSLALLFALALMLAMAQLLPTLAYVSRTTRASGLPLHELLVNSLHPLRLLELFFGNFFGNFTPDFTYWGANLLTKFIRPFIYSSYIGGSALFLLTSGLYFFLRKPTFSVGRLFWLTLLLLLLTLGTYAPIPLYAFFAKWLPFWNIFRYPERLLFWLTLCLILLQGRILRRFFLHLQLQTKSGLYAIVAGLLGTYCVSAFLLWENFPASAAGSVKNTLVFSTLLALLLYFARGKILRASVTKTLLVLLLVADLFGHANSLVWDQPKDLLDVRNYPHIVQAQEIYVAESDLRKSGAPFRMATTFFQETSMERLQLLKDLDHAGKYVFAHLESLTVNAPNIFGLYEVGGYLTLYSPTANLLADTILDREKLFDLMSVRFRPRRADNFADIWRESDRRRRSTLPYFYFPKTVWNASDQKAAMLLAVSRDFARERFAVTEHPVSFANNGVQEVTLQERRPDTLRFTWKSTTKKNDTLFFVLNESYDPNWRLKTATGSYAPIRVNGWAMGFSFPAPSTQGSQSFTLKYADPWFYAGLLVSILGILTSILYLSPQCRSFLATSEAKSAKKSAAKCT